MKKFIFGAVAFLSLCSLRPFYETKPAYTWGNGGYSKSARKVKYGTHDWILEEALKMLPKEERQWIEDDLANAMLGTEGPDSPDVSRKHFKNYKGWRGPDKRLQHVHFLRERGEGVKIDDACARRAQDEYTTVVKALRAAKNAKGKNKRMYKTKMTEARRRLGAMSHYMSDPHWAQTTSHENMRAHISFESFVDKTIVADRLKDPKNQHRSTMFQKYVKFDGELEKTSAHDATVQIARTSHYGDEKILGHKRMERLILASRDKNKRFVPCKKWPPKLLDSTGHCLNKIINKVAAVVHGVYLEAGK